MAQLLRSAEEMLGVGESPAPTVEPDEQSMLGNSALLGFLGLGEEPQKLDGSGMAEAAKDVSAVAEGTLALLEHNPDLADEDLQKAAKLYADIKRGRTNFEFDTSNLSDEEAEAFRAAAMGDMAKVMTTETGRELIETLARDPSGRTVVIGTPGVVGTSPDEPKTRGWLPGMDDPATPWKVDRDMQNGTGVNSIVGYQPGHTAKTEDGEIRSDIVLYHELVHAWQFSKGTTTHDEASGVDLDEYEATWYDRFNENLYRDQLEAQGDDVGDRDTYGGQPSESYPHQH